MVFDAHAAEHPLAERRAGQEKSVVLRKLLEREARHLRAFEGQRVRKMDLVTACGEDDVRLLLDAAGGRGRVECLPSGVDLDAFAEDGPAAASGHVVLTGSMSWEPNVDAAVWMAREILPELRRRIPGCQVFVVGRRPAPEVRALASIPGVVVTGTVPDVRPYLRRARCLLVPARVGGGTRVKILEAFAARVPVVSTPVGIEGIEATPGRDLLIGQTPAELAEQVVRLEADPSLAPRLTAAGRALVEEKYGWATLQGRLAALHQEALREHLGRRLSARV
jgi:glycosyltransferase involved in cell wall biosynthesis